MLSVPAEQCNQYYIFLQGGLYIIGHVYERDFDSLEGDPAEEGKRHWMALIDWLRVKAFPELTVARYVA